MKAGYRIETCDQIKFIPQHSSAGPEMKAGYRIETYSKGDEEFGVLGPEMKAGYRIET